MSPPIITTPPHDLTLGRGTNAFFSVIAIGTQPLAYQWRFNTNPLSGATASSYTRTNPQCADAGNYDIIVTNALGSVTSSVATLTVVAPPSISTQPTNQTVQLGQSFFFNVSATNDCGGGFAYQWRLQNTNIAGATSTGYTNTNAQLTDAGDYSVVVTNLGGSVTGLVGTLTVNIAPPVILLGPLNSSNFIFSFSTVSGKTYIVQYDDLTADTNWQTLTSIPGDGTTQVLSNSLSTAPRRFYRLLAQ
jgi:hypothetical protein